MNLKDWCKLSPEEQRLRFDERPNVPASELCAAREEIKLSDKIVEIPIAERKSPRWPCPAGMIELRNQLNREIQYEADASNRYRLAAGKLYHFGMKQLAEKARLIAAEELAHKAVLEAAVEIITTACEE